MYGYDLTERAYSSPAETPKYQLTGFDLTREGTGRLVSVPCSMVPVLYNHKLARTVLVIRGSCLDAVQPMVQLF